MSDKKSDSLRQIIMYALLGCVASVVELAVFALCNYLLFSDLKSVDFSWGMFAYTADNGGLCYFLALAVSFIAAQTVNFILQRKKTFAADNNPVVSAVLFAVMMLGIFLLQLWLPCVLRASLSAFVGADTAELLLKILCMFLGFVITYPLNKYVIMRKKSTRK